MIKRRPYRVESRENHHGLRIQVVDKYGEVVLGGFGYFYEDTLREFVAALNGVGKAAMTAQLKKLPWSQWAQKHDPRVKR